MDETPEQLDAPKPNLLNKQMPPLAGGAFFGAIAFGFIFYKHHDFVRAALVGCAGFAGGFGVMLIGTYKDRRQSRAIGVSVSEWNGGMSKYWRASILAFVGFALEGGAAVALAFCYWLHLAKPLVAVAFLTVSGCLFSLGIVAILYASLALGGSTSRSAVDSPFGPKLSS